MKRKIIFIIAFVISFTGAIYAQDLRAVRLEKFLARHCPTSPLRGKGAEIVRWADKYDLDYRLYLAITGVESTWGKKFPKRSYNFTGISNGAARFRSISHNIRFTHETIATKRWYRRYHRTKNLKDFVYVYKGVPPYDRYLRGLRFTLDLISGISIAGENKPAEAAAGPPPSFLLALNTIRYDRFANRSMNTVSLTP